MAQLKVGARLGLGFGLLLLLMVVAVLVGFLGIRAAEQQVTRLERENVALLKSTAAMQVAQMAQAVAIRDYVGIADVESQRAALRALKAGEAAYEEAAKELAAVAAATQDRGALVGNLAQLQASGAKVAAKIHEALDLVDSAEYQQAQSIVFKDVRGMQAAIAADLGKVADRAQALAQERARAARTDAQAGELRLVLALIAALVAGVLATLVITRGIVRPLGAAVQAAERVADGDLTGLQVQARSDETGRVLSALGAMQRSLNTLVRSVRAGSDAVASASERIAHGNTDLASRTEEQAAALEETAAGVEELTASVQQNTANATRGSELAREAADLAGQGGGAVREVIVHMDDIQGSARRVADIVGIVDGIAFQTNLLALNAAVEAARAGEHGRGFAVVATEVRVLAQRSAAAAKDIKKLAAEAVGQADTGARAASRAGETMDRVVRVAQDVAQLVAAIARASEEQRAGIEQVNATIGHLDAATQSNASLVQENTGLTDSLLASARELVAAANRFRLDAGEQAVATIAVLPAEAPAWEPARPALQ